MSEPAVASEAQLAAGRALLARRDARRWVLACDRDADGLSAAVLLARALARLGRPPTAILPARRGEHIHHPDMLARVRAHAPDALLVLDMGSRDLPILPGVPTLLIDHHQPRGFPPGATVVSGHGHEPVAPTSLLGFTLARPLVDIEDLDWLALLGTFGDLGASAPFPAMQAALARYGRAAVAEAVALINAARRAGDADVETSLAVLQRAPAPAAIARGHVSGVERLQACRELVKRELARAGRAAPRFSGRFALVRFSSPAQVHPLLATRWARRLPRQIVIAANDGYLPGRVNFALRSALDVNLVDLLRAVPLDGAAGEWGFGHPRATGGSLAPPDFDRLLAALGFPSFPPEGDRPAVAPRTAAARP